MPIDYAALAEEARTPETPPVSGGKVDYGSLAHQARSVEIIDDPRNVYSYTENGIPVYMHPPGVPPPPIPYELQTPEQQQASAPVWRNPRTGLQYRPQPLGTVPILDDPYAGTKQALEGFTRMGAAQSPSDVARGESDVIRGGFTAATPFFLGLGVERPLATALGMGIFTGTQQVIERTAKTFGMPDGYARLAGDLAGIFGGERTYHWLSGLSKAAVSPEADAIHRTLTGVMAQLQDPNIQPWQKNQLRAQAEGLLDGLRNAEKRTLLPALFPVQLTPQEQANQDYLTSRGIKTPLSMQTGNEAAQGIEATLQRTPGGGAFSQNIKAQKEKLIGQVAPAELERIYPQPVTKEEAGRTVRGQLSSDLERMKAELSAKVSPKAITPEKAGAGVISGLEGKIKGFDKEADTHYKDAYAAADDPYNVRSVPATGKDGRTVMDDNGQPVTVDMKLPVDMSSVQELVGPIIKDYEYTLTETQRRDSPGLLILKNILSSDRFKPLPQAERDLGMLKRAADTEMPELRDASQGMAAAVIPSLQKLIDQTMASAHYPGYDPASGAPHPGLQALRNGRLATARKYEVTDLLGQYVTPGSKFAEPVQVFGQSTWGADKGIARLRQLATELPDSMAEIGRAYIDSGGNWDQLGLETKKILFKDPETIKGLDQYYAQQKRVGPLLGLEPVALFDRMTASGGKRNELLRDIAQLTPEQQPMVARAFVKGLLDRVTREGNIQKVQGTLDKWLDMDPEAKAALLQGSGKGVRTSPGLVSDLDNLFFALKRMAGNPNPSGSGFIFALNQMKGNIFKGLGAIAGSMAGTTHGPVGAGIGAGLGTLAGVGAEYGANAALSRLLFNRKFIQLMTEGIRTDLGGDSARAKIIARTLAKMAGEGPPEEPPAGTTPPTGPSGGPGGPPPPPGGGGGGVRHPFAWTSPGTEEGSARQSIPSLQERLQTLGDAAMERIRNRGTFSGTKLNAAVPVDDLADMAIWGAAKIAKGTIGYASWAKEMVSDAGEQVKPYLKQMYADSQKIFERHLKTTENQLPNTKHLLKLINEGKDGADWYAKTKDELIQHFGKKDADRIIDFLAATTNNATVAANVALALKAYKQYRTGEPFEGYLDDVKDQLRAVMEGQDFGGLKVKSFRAALKGDPDAVTIDRWMHRAFGFRKSGITPTQYKFMDYIVTQIARRQDMEPRQVQAAIWRAIKESEQRAKGNTSEPFEALLPKKLANDPQLRALAERARAGEEAPPRP